MSSSSVYTGDGSRSAQGRGAPRASDLGSGPQAVARYQHMVQCAPPETLERSYAEAFRELEPEQRRRVLEELAQAAPRDDRDVIRATSPDDVAALALHSTRAEVREPGLLPRLFTREDSGLGARLFASFAARFVASAAANQYLRAHPPQP